MASVTPDASVAGDTLRLSARQGLAVAVAGGIPQDVRIQMEVTPEPGSAVFGLRLRAPLLLPTATTWRCWRTSAACG